MAKKSDVSDKPKKKYNYTEKTGRPLTYTKELAERICHLIGTTSKSVTKLCKEYPDLPTQETIYTWRNKFREFSDMYFEAKRQQILIYAEETIDIADDDSRDTILTASGEEKMNGEWIARSKARIATRQWHCARLMPKLFGDKMNIEATGLSQNKELEQTVKQLQEQIEILKQNERDY